MITCPDMAKARELLLAAGWQGPVNTRSLGHRMSGKGQNNDTALLFALRKKVFEVVPILIKQGASINVRDGSLNTPFHLLAIHQKVSLDWTRLFIELGVDINQVNQKKESVLSYVLNLKSHLSGNIPSINHDWLKCVLDAGLMVNRKDTYGFGSLMHAVASPQHHSIVPILLASGANPDMKDGVTKTTALFYVEGDSHQRAAMYELLIKAGANVNHVESINKRNALFTIKKEACKFDCKIWIKVLTHAGIDIGQKDNLGITPLMWAALEKNHHVFRALLELDPHFDLDFHTQQVSEPTLKIKAPFQRTLLNVCIDRAEKGFPDCLIILKSYLDSAHLQKALPLSSKILNPSTKRM